MSEDRMVWTSKAKYRGSDHGIDGSPFFCRPSSDVHDLRENGYHENVLSTGVGNGIVFHIRAPVTTLRAPASVIYGLKKGGFQCTGWKSCSLLFWSAAEYRVDLHLMADGRLLKNEDFLKALPKCVEKADVIKLVMEHERDEFLIHDRLEDEEN